MENRRHRTFTMADAEKVFRRNYDMLYRQAAKGQNLRAFRVWYEGDMFDREELNALLELNEKLAAEIGTPEPAHVRGMTREDMIRYLRPTLWGAERRLLHYELIPKPALPPDGRREKILERNYDVALVSAIYELFPDEHRKLTPGDLMIEFFDDPTAEATASESGHRVSP